MRTLLSIAAAALFAGSLAVAHAQDQSATDSAALEAAQLRALPPASRDALTAWLERDCSVGLPEGAATSLRAIPGVAPGVLIEAYDQGPPPELERAYTAAFDQAYEARNEILAQEGDELVGEENAALLRNVSREAYVARRLDQARLNYRTNAVLGLGAVGDDEALGVLERVAADSDSPMRAAAQQAIAIIQQRELSGD